MAAEAPPEPLAKPAVPMDAERLRDIARRLATADPAPPAPVRRPSADEELDDLPGPGNVTSGYALRRRARQREEQAAGDVDRHRARAASGCGSSRCSGPCRAPTTDEASGSPGLGRMTAFDRLTPAPSGVPARQIGICRAGRLDYVQRRQPAGGMQRLGDERQADRPDRHAQGRSRHQAACQDAAAVALQGAAAQRRLYARWSS